MKKPYSCYHIGLQNARVLTPQDRNTDIQKLYFLHNKGFTYKNTLPPHPPKYQEPRRICGHCYLTVIYRPAGSMGICAETVQICTLLFYTVQVCKLKGHFIHCSHCMLRWSDVLMGNVTIQRILPGFRQIIAIKCSLHSFNCSNYESRIYRN
jgi:hypothetical protein